MLFRKVNILLLSLIIPLFLSPLFPSPILPNIYCVRLVSNFLKLSTNTHKIRLKYILEEAIDTNNMLLPLLHQNIRKQENPRNKFAFWNVRVILVSPGCLRFLCPNKCSLEKTLRDRLTNILLDARVGRSNVCRWRNEGCIRNLECVYLFEKS